MNILHKNEIDRPHIQRGVITLAMSLILLFLITLVTLAVTRNISIEQKVTNNDVRSRIAFEAAEAGIAAAFDPANLNTLLLSEKDLCGDISDARCLVQASVLSEGRYSIRSKGVYIDDSASRTIRIRAVQLDPLPNLPTSPLTAQASVVVDGSATIYNPEGDSTIWSGETVDLGSNNSTATEIADPYDPGFPSCMDTPLTCNTISSSNKVTIGPDVIENDGTLGNLTEENFFRSYFGTDLTIYTSQSVTIDVDGEDASSDEVLQKPGEVILIKSDADFTNNSTYGCSEKVTGNQVCPSAIFDPDNPAYTDPTDPNYPGYESSIVIVDGNATFNGTVHFYGLVYVVGNLEITGNTTIYGALVVGGDLINNTGGSLDLYYHSGLLENAGGGGAFFAASGSWRDYEVAGE